MHAHSVQTTVVVKAGPFGASGYHVQHKVCLRVEVARHREMVVSAGTFLSARPSMPEFHGCSSGRAKRAFKRSLLGFGDLSVMGMQSNSTLGL